MAHPYPINWHFERTVEIIWHRYTDAGWMQVAHKMSGISTLLSGFDNETADDADLLFSIALKHYQDE